VTGDCYAILGVHPAAEDVVIGAAYRALMRHYHPDTNPDPAAQARAREITAAYALLRDPAKRAEYDARRAAEGDLWREDEPPPPAPPPAMRAAGIVSALAALGLVVVVWARPQTAPPARGPSVQSAPSKSVAADPGPASLAELGPEHERLAALREEIAPPGPPLPVADVAAPTPEAIDPAIPVKLASAAPVRPRPQPKRDAAPSRTASNAKPQRPGSERVATLDRLSSGFFSQSMVHATTAKKEQLLSMRDRLAAERGACRSEACVAGTYVRQMRETSAIMEGRLETAK
jgi:hypothetical protein